MPPLSRQNGKVVGVPGEFLDDNVDDEIRSAVETALKVFESQGATIEDISLPYTKYGVAAYYVIALSEASSNLSRYDGIRYPRSVREGETLEDIYVDSKSTGFNDEAK